MALATVRTMTLEAGLLCSPTGGAATIHRPPWLGRISLTSAALPNPLIHANGCTFWNYWAVASVGNQRPETPWVQNAYPTRSLTLVTALSVGAPRSPPSVTLPIPATHDGSGVYRGPASLDQEKNAHCVPFIGEGAGEGHGSSWSEYMNDTSPADYPGDQQGHEARHSSGRVVGCTMSASEFAMLSCGAS
jgi:hypothetical protein